MIDQTTFEQLRSLVYREGGISLSNDKLALVTSRVSKRMRALGLQDAEQYLRIIETDHSGEELKQLLDVISTNVTSFFREKAHFDLLSRLCEVWKRESRTRIRLWCAASSTGEEPYSILMTLAESLPLERHDIRLLASDISLRVLQHATAGRYSKDAVGKVPPDLLRKYFEEDSNAEKPFLVSRRLRELVTFKRLNLSQHPFPLRGPLDVIFCRNVMIYFDNKLRQALISQFEHLLAVGGHLIVGQTESLLGLSHSLTQVEPSVYRREK
jgi:chemotaxis protein methyltransferase CheR